MPEKRDAKATRRIMTLLVVLADHEKYGIDAGTLISQVGMYEAKPENVRDELSRDLRKLRRAGHVIQNVAKRGHPAIYRLVPGDDRLGVELDLEQRNQLARAAVLVGMRLPGPACAGTCASTRPTARTPAPAIRSELVLRAFLPQGWCDRT